MSHNSKCHLHIPQLQKGIYVLNLIVQGILEKRSEKKGPQRNIQNPNTSNNGIKI
jgi:hypothetical protein